MKNGDMKNEALQKFLKIIRLAMITKPEFDKDCLYFPEWFRPIDEEAGDEGYSSDLQNFIHLETAKKLTKVLVPRAQHTTHMTELFAKWDDVAVEGANLLWESTTKYKKKEQVAFSLARRLDVMVVAQQIVQLDQSMKKDEDIVLRDLFLEYDKDGNGVFEFDEFKSVTLSINPALLKEEYTDMYMQALDMISKDDSSEHTMSPDSFIDIARKYGLPHLLYADENGTLSTAMEGFKRYDSQNTGEIDVEHFKSLVRETLVNKLEQIKTRVWLR
jgi:Ca2+-binding EF-hand superfamily protein